MNNVSDVILPGSGQAKYASYAGDINVDGYSDIILGDYSYNNYTGRVNIFYGGTSMDNVEDITFYGNTSGDTFGGTVSNAGDVNGDGYFDILIEDRSYNHQTGRSYLYFNLMPKPVLINPLNNSVNNPITTNFKWKKLRNTIYYIILASPDSLFNNIVVVDTIFSDTSKSITGFQRNTKYYWKVLAKDSSGFMNNSLVWNFTTLPPIKINMKVLLEGMYYQVFNLLTRKDTVKVYLRNSSTPYAIVDSTKGTIDSLTFSGLFNFIKAFSGSYFIVVKHFNCIETWSKSGGENLVADGSVYNYDFTTSNIQAYGNNLKLKGSKYCIYSGDADQSDFIDVADIILIFNNATALSSGRFIPSDLNGDNFVDTDDMIICFNNMKNLIGVIRP